MISGNIVLYVTNNILIINSHVTVVRYYNNNVINKYSLLLLMHI